MAFIQIENGNIKIDDSNSNIKNIIDGFCTLIEKKRFDTYSLSCGLSSSPDFGYFELANRYWQASLCIYSFGATGCFRGKGVGFAEPWLFNLRHAIELYIKGFLLNTIWLEELQTFPHLSARKDEFENLIKEFGKPHKLFFLYERYIERIENVIINWNTNDIEVPDLNFLILKAHELEFLTELDLTDATSFRFRYPSLKEDNIDFLQEINWKHDMSMLYPETGLPKEAGYFFDHVKVMNSFYILIEELISIVNYFKGINFYQDLMNDYWFEFTRSLGF